MGDTTSSEEPQELVRLKEAFEVFRAEDEKYKCSGDFSELYRILSQSCDLLRCGEVEGKETIIPSARIDAVAEFVGEIVDYATDPDNRLCESLASFAHFGLRSTSTGGTPPDYESGDEQETNLIPERIPQGVMSHNLLAQVLRVFEEFKRSSGSNGPLPRPPDAYDSSHKPHPSSSPLARFNKISGLSPSDSTPTAKLLYDARCEVTCLETSTS
ncbi:hypothetical protein HYDPIDRAFT_26170, partial [Hydnomerulius pinastri MD-312]